MRQARMMQKYCLSSRLQQIPGSIDNTYRSVTCKFSKSSGPVRYTPRGTKQPKNPSTQDLAKSLRHDVQEANKHVPAMPSRSQGSGLAESLYLNCDLTKQDGKTLTKCGFSLVNENNLSSAAGKAPQIFESSATDARAPKRSLANSAEVFEVYKSTQDMPVNSHDFSQQSSSPSDWFASPHHSGKCQEEARGGFLFEEDENRTTTYDRKYAAEWRDKGPRQENSADLAKVSISTKMQKTFGMEAGDNVGFTSVSENGLDSNLEKAKTKEKNRFACMESNIESKARPQAVEAITSLTILGKHPVKKESDFQESKRMPCQDVETFLLKAQKAKRRVWEPLSKSHAAASVEGSLCIDDNNNERDDTDDDRCLFLGQETLGEKEDVVVNFKDLNLNSIAAREHAKNQAIRHLAMRPYTAFQLRKKLESQSITSELADYAVATVQKCGLQSDLAFAETFARARFNHGSWGPQKIKLGLKQRGISNEVIQVAIANVFHKEENDPEQYGTSENDEKSNTVAMSRAAMDHLLVQATKQWNRGRNANNETKIRRMVSWLQYRGFNYNVIKTVLMHVQQEIRIEDE